MSRSRICRVPVPLAGGIPAQTHEYIDKQHCIGVNKLSALYSELLEPTATVHTPRSRFHNHMQFAELVFLLEFFNHRSTARVSDHFSHYPAFCGRTACMVQSAAGDTCCMLKQPGKLLLFRPQSKPQRLANAAPSLTTNLFTGRGFVITGLSSAPNTASEPNSALFTK